MSVHPLVKVGLPGLILAAAAATTRAQTTPSPAPAASATAQQVADRVADPAAPVPAVLYRSVFADTPQGLEVEVRDWKKANADVGQFRRGHADVLKWEATQGSKP